MQPRVRVVHVIARLNVGGPASHTVLLTDRLDPRRYESYLITGAVDQSEGDYLKLQKRAVEGLIMIPALGREIRAGADLAALFQLYRLLRRLRPEIVHTHTAKAGALARVAALMAHVPIIVHTYHGHVFHSYFTKRRTQVFLAIERWLAPKTSRLIAVSNKVRAELLALGIGTADKLVAVPLGLDLDDFVRSETKRGQLRAELGLADDMPLVGIVARLVPVKAHEVFLEAAAIVARLTPAARFLIVGDGERRTELETVAKQLGIEDRVTFLGWRVDLDRVYADLDIVVLCSRNEGSPVCLIEAMAAGRAVVATSVGGVPELVEDGATGVLVAEGDAAGLAAGISTLICNPWRRGVFGIAGRKRVSPAFSSNRLVKDVDRLYTELLAGIA
jgi:glycosyltransferase involved in cell wall biosynthesis